MSAEVLLKELQAVKTKWYLIGMKLEFSQRRLNVIRLEHGAAPDKCLGLLCQEWVAASKEAATWSKVVDALRTDLVKERELANTLERGYCWLESPNSKTWVRITLMFVSILSTEYRTLSQNLIAMCTVPADVDISIAFFLLAIRTEQPCRQR